MPVRAGEPEWSIDRSSIPSLTAVSVIPPHHQTPGDLLALQLVMCRPGEIVTTLPLIACIATSWVWARFPSRPIFSQPPAWYAHAPVANGPLADGHASSSWARTRIGPTLSPPTQLRRICDVPRAEPAAQLA